MTAGCFPGVDRIHELLFGPNAKLAARSQVGRNFLDRRVWIRTAIQVRAVADMAIIGVDKVLTILRRCSPGRRRHMDIMADRLGRKLSKDTRGQKYSCQRSEMSRLHCMIHW